MTGATDDIQYSPNHILLILRRDDLARRRQMLNEIERINRRWGLGRYRGQAEIELPGDQPIDFARSAIAEKRLDIE